MNLPNSITLSRLLGLPLILYWLHQGTEIDRWLSLIIFLIAASTDWLDGYLAPIAGWRINPNLTGNSDIKGANWWGKSKTVSQIIAIALLIAPLPSEYNLIAQFAFWLSVTLTLISGVIYVTQN